MVPDTPDARTMAPKRVRRRRICAFKGDVRLNLDTNIFNSFSCPILDTGLEDENIKDNSDMTHGCAPMEVPDAPAKSTRRRTCGFKSKLCLNMHTNYFAALKFVTFQIDREIDYGDDLHDIEPPEDDFDIEDAAGKFTFK